MKRWFSFAAFVTVLALSIGCSGGGSTPVASGVTPDTPGGQINLTAASSGTNTSLLGYYDIYFDIGNGTFEAVANRNASFTLNIVAFLNQMTIPYNGITFDQIVIHNDDPSFIGVDVEFTIYHPFPGYDQYQAYDLRGVVIGNGVDILEYGNLRTGLHGTDLWMKNPDGYTRWFNPTEFTTEMIFGYTPGGFQNLAGDANLNPYKYYGKHLDWDGNLWSWLTEGPNFDGVFESGTGRKMELEFPMPPEGIGLMFGYAVVVAWEEQGPDGPYTPYHIPEAVAVSVSQTPDVWYDGVDSGGDLILDIDLFAWEHQPSAVKIESSVLSGIAEFDFGTYAGEGGEHYSTWHVEAPAGTLVSSEDHDAWIIAECNAFDYSNGLPDIPHAEGSLAAFFRTAIVVGTESPHLQANVFTIDPECSEVDEILTGVAITGEYFETGCAVELEFSPGDLITGQNVNVIDSENLEVDFDLTGATIGLYDVKVTNPTMAPGILEDGFEVVPTPIVTDLDPEFGIQNNLLTDVEVIGTGFHADCTLEIINDSSETLPIENFEWIDSTTLEFDVDLTGITLGYYDVIVTNPCDAEPGLLEDGFMVALPTWPTSQGTPGNTGYVEYLNGPTGNFGAPTWVEGSGMGNAQGTFISHDTIYYSFIGWFGGYLPTVAINMSDHSLKWEQAFQTSNGARLEVAAVSRDGNVVLCCQMPEARIYGLDADDGSEIWQTPGEIGVDAYANLDLDGNFVVGVKGVGYMSIQPDDGTINWTATIGDPAYCTPAVGPDGTIYGTAGTPYGQFYAYLHALDPATGYDKWSSNPYIGEIHNGVTVHPDSGNIILHNRTGGGQLNCFQDNGTSYSIAWQQSYPYPWYTSVAVGPNGYIYMIDDGGTLRQIDPDNGTTVNSTSGWNEYAGRPAIGDDGLIYVNGDSNFYCFNPDCTLKWSYYIFGGSFGAPAIGSDGWVYTIKRQYGLCAWHD